MGTMSIFSLLKGKTISPEECDEFCHHDIAALQISSCLNLFVRVFLLSSLIL